ncbi:MAG: enoyl-[acyl-carrier-protein] reductase FabK [Bacteroidales bacterium]|nr:enoyl-[acyl-carrier-protein] reductase FabK [Bacteroidales bacterium]
MRKFNSRICDLLSITYPIFQGGMAWVSDPVLAAAVSNAGGLGILSAMSADAAFITSEIAKIRTLTDKPFGVNIMLMSPFADQVAQAVIEEQVPVVTTGAGMPGKYMESWNKAGLTIIPVVASVAFARRLERMGAAAVIAEGAEAGGHVGDLNTMALVPQVCDAVSIPVIAAGGIADGRGMAAAFMLGAEGVQCGTCFLAAEECRVHQAYKEKIVNAGDTDTIVTGKKLGHPVRALKTPFTRKFAQMENNPDMTQEDADNFGTGALRRAVLEGDGPMGCYMAGQSAGLVKKIQPASAIIQEMAEQAAQLLQI